MPSEQTIVAYGLRTIDFRVSSTSTKNALLLRVCFGSFWTLKGKVTLFFAIKALDFGEFGFAHVWIVFFDIKVPSNGSSRF
jgi:hypothetical protein